MTSEHPITPPPELVEEWASDVRNAQHFATQAAKWGYQQAIKELETFLEKQQ